MEPLKGIIRSCFKLGFGIVAERGHTIYFTNDKKYALLGPNQSPRGSECWVVVWRPLPNHSFYWCRSCLDPWKQVGVYPLCSWRTIHQVQLGPDSITEWNTKGIVISWFLGRHIAEPEGAKSQITNPAAKTALRSTSQAAGFIDIPSLLPAVFTDNDSEEWDNHVVSRYSWFYFIECSYCSYYLSLLVCGCCVFVRWIKSTIEHYPISRKWVAVLSSKRLTRIIFKPHQTTSPLY